MGKKILLVFVAVLCTLPMRGDDPPETKKEIPVKEIGTRPTVRDFSILPLQVYYDGMIHSINTVVISDMGMIEVIVTNLITGENWWDAFDSAFEPQSVLKISGTSGYYEVMYITQSGDVYVGEFLIE